jgi:acetylxylan esterase
MITFQTDNSFEPYQRIRQLRVNMKAFATVLGLLASASSAFGALQQVTGFGTNPTGVQMYISVPARIATNPAIIVAVGPVS